MKNNILNSVAIGLACTILSIPLSLSGQVSVVQGWNGNFGTSDDTGVLRSLTELQSGDLVVVALASSQDAASASYSMSASGTATFGSFNGINSTARNSSWIMWGNVTGSGDADILLTVVGTQTSNAAVSVLRPTSPGNTLGIVTDFFDVVNADGSLGDLSDTLDFTLPGGAVSGSSNYAITALATDVSTASFAVDSLLQSPTMTALSAATNLNRYTSESQTVDSSSGVFSITNTLSTQDPTVSFTGAGAVVYAAVPEPSILALLSGLLAMTLVLNRRRRLR